MLRTGHVGRADAHANNVTLPPTRRCGPYDGGQRPHHITHFSLPFKDLTDFPYPYQHHGLHDDTDRCTLYYSTLKPSLYILRGANIRNLEWRIIHQLNDDHQTSGRHSTSAATIVERHRHDTEANASQDTLSTISIIGSCEEIR